MTWFVGIALLVGLCMAGKMCWRPIKFAVMLLIVLGLVRVIGGPSIFGSHRDDERIVHVDVQDRVDEIIERHANIGDRITEAVDRHTSSLPDRIAQAVDRHTNPDRIRRYVERDRERGSDWWPDQGGDEGVEHHQMSRGLMVALGTVLVIVVWLLIGRDRTKPGALKAFTLLGMAAVVLVLVTVFTGTPHARVRHNRDYVVKNVADAPSPVVSDANERPQSPKQAKTPKRATRAKRPASRGERAVTTEELRSEMPARAGEIPLDKEAASPAAPADAPAAAAPGPENAPASEPAAAVEAEAAAAPSSEPALAEATPAPEKPAPASEPAATTDAAPAAAPEKPATPAASDPPAPAPAASPSDPSDAPAAAEASSRPSWIETPGKLEESTYRIAVKSGLYVSVPECQRALDQAIKHEAEQYIDELLGEKGAAALVDIPARYLREHVKKAEYGEVLQVSVGPMHQIHALLEFDEDARATFYDRWRTAVVNHRLWYAGSVGAVVLALLGTFYGYLTLDLRTGGAQKGRLQLAATLVALIVAAAALLARWAVPF